MDCKMFIIYGFQPNDKFKEFKPFPQLYGYAAQLGEKLQLKIEDYESLETDNYMDHFFFLKNDDDKLKEGIDNYHRLIKQFETTSLNLPFVKGVCQIVLKSKPEYQLKYQTEYVNYIIELLDSGKLEILEELIKCGCQVSRDQKIQIFQKMINNQRKDEIIQSMIKRDFNTQFSIGFINFLAEAILYSDEGKDISNVISLEYFNETNLESLLKLYVYSPRLFQIKTNQHKFDIYVSDEEDRDYYLLHFTQSKIRRLGVPSLEDFYVQIISRQPISDVLFILEKYKDNKKIENCFKKYIDILQKYIKFEGNFIVYTAEYDRYYMTIDEYFSKHDKNRKNVVKIKEKELPHVKWFKFLEEPPLNLTIYIISKPQKLSLHLPFHQLYLPSNSIEFAKLFSYDEEQKKITIKGPENVARIIQDNKLSRNHEFVSFIRKYLSKKEKDVLKTINQGTYAKLYDEITNCYEVVVTQIIIYLNSYDITADYIQMNKEKWKNLSEDLLNDFLVIDSIETGKNKLNSPNNLVHIQLDFLKRQLNGLIEIFKEYEANIIQIDTEEDYNNENTKLADTLNKIQIPQIIQNIDINEFINYLIDDYISTYFFSDKIEAKQIITFLFGIQMEEVTQLNLKSPLYYYYLWIYSKRDIINMFVNMSCYSKDYPKLFSMKVDVKLTKELHAIVNKSVYSLNEILIQNAFDNLGNKSTIKNYNRNLLDLSFLSNEAHKIQIKAWMFTQVLLRLEYLLKFAKYSKDETIVQDILTTKSDFDVLKHLNKINKSQIVIELLIEKYKVFNDEQQREILVNTILNDYSYLKHSGQFIQITLRRVFCYDLDDADTSFLWTDEDFFLLQSLEKVLRNNDNIQMKECLEQILLYFFDCFFLTFLPVNSKKENVEKERAINFLKEALVYLEGFLKNNIEEEHKEHKHLKKLYCISYCKLFLSNFSLVLKDLDQSKDENKNQYAQYSKINSLLSKQTPLNEMMKFYILKTLRKNQSSFAEFRTFSFITNQMLWVKNYSFKEAYPSNFDFIFYSELYDEEYEAMKDNIEKLREAVFRIGTYDDEIHISLSENVDVFLNVTFNIILSNLYYSEYSTKQEYSEFSMWVENLIKTAPKENKNTKLFEMMERIFYQVNFKIYLNNGFLSLEYLEILFISFKFAICFCYNDKVYNLVKNEFKLQNLKDDDYVIEEIKEYYHNNGMLNSYAIINKGNKQCPWKVVDLLSEQHEKNNAVFLNKDHQVAIEKVFEIKFGHSLIYIDNLNKRFFAMYPIELMTQKYIPTSDKDDEGLLNDLKTKFFNFIIYSFKFFSFNSNLDDMKKLVSFWKAFTLSLHSFSIDEPKLFFNFTFDSFKKMFLDIKDITSGNIREKLVEYFNTFIEINIAKYAENRFNFINKIYEKMHFDPKSKKCIFQELYKKYDEYEAAYDGDNFPFWKLFFYVNYPNSGDLETQLKNVYQYEKKYPLICLFLNNQEPTKSDIENAVEGLPYYHFIDRTKFDKTYKRKESESSESRLAYDGFYNSFEDVIKAFSYRDIFGKNGIDYGNSDSIVYYFDLIEKELALFTYQK